MNENEQPPSVATAEAKPEHSEGIDFGSVSALANSEFTPEPWYKSLGFSVLEKLLAFGLFILGIILDVFKTLYVIVKGLFVGIYKIGLGVYHFFRNVVRMCKEGDRYVKCSTFCCGLGNIHGGQKADGFIYLGVEILFLIYMAAFGWRAILNLILLGLEDRMGLPDWLSEVYWDEDFEEFKLPSNSSLRFLIVGILTIMVIAAFVFVWYSSLKSAHDNYIIRHNLYFMQAHADQVKAVNELHRYDEFFTSETKNDPKGGTYVKLKFKSPKQIYTIARNTYGFSELSARYISYLPWSHYPEKAPNGFERFVTKIKDGFYKKYAAVAAKIKQGKWSSVFGKYLEWEPMKKKVVYGSAYVRDVATAEFNRFRHTYDKYNDYLSVTRDMESLIRVLEKPELIVDAIYARDPVSAQNGLQPVDQNEVVKPKVAASRIVGAFECSYDDGVRVATYYNRAVKDQPKTGVEPLQQLRNIHKALVAKREDFIRVNSTQRLAGVHEVLRLYQNPKELEDLYVSGKQTFIDALSGKDAEGNCRYVSVHEAKSLFREVEYVHKQFQDDPARINEYFAKRAEDYKDTVAVFEKYPFHGQPLRFKKKAKQFLDERFAVTVMSLPVLGAMVSCVIPLIISIIVAFTAYTGSNAATGNFGWDASAWANMFNMTGSGNLGGTFLYILGWDMVWAFFATFTNYILGIVLALLINKKSIKFKKVFRMFFVISIAIPQFVTLLAMSKILGPGGPINKWAYDQGWTTSLDTWWLNDPTNQGLSAKICLILVNVWIGIPYTMLSTSGILMNIPEDLYESASIDGASPWTQFWKITMPYILFVTGPSLLTTFIGNINNFNVIYFLTGGGPGTGGILHDKAGYTDLLITFLFKITVEADTHLYSIGSVIGILVFAICAFFSLIVYARMGSTQNEEAFQ